MNRHSGIKAALLLGIVSMCFFEPVFHRQSNFVLEFEEAFLSLQWMLLVCITLWCGSLLFLTFRLNDLPLIGLLLITIAAYFICCYAAASTATDAIILLAGVTLGRGVRVLLILKAKGQRLKEGGEMQGNVPEFSIQHSAFSIFLIGLVVLLAFSSWWYLDMTGAYHGPRWMGLWNNPNIYGMLMGAGMLLAIGLLAAKERKEHKENENTNFSPCPSPRLAKRGWNFLRSLRSFAAKKTVGDSRSLSLRIFLFIAAGMMAVGLLFSYSRGAWAGTAVGLLYLVKAHGKLKWRFMLPVVLVVATVVAFFWHSTADTDAWYLKRLDFSRPSAQHRVSAWRGAVQMMRDHPFGVGWNKAVDVYDKNYSPPEGGAAALTMNSYLMLGTELGLPGLICFVGYVALCFRRVGRKSHLSSEARKREHEKIMAPVPLIRADDKPVLLFACRAGALVLLVAFWFDGGLFELATTSVFWILLELGSAPVQGSMSKVQNGTGEVPA